MNNSVNSFEKECISLTKIKNHLIKLSKEYGLGNVKFKSAFKNDLDDISSFIIEVPNNWEYSQISKVWDEIIEETVIYAENENIISCLNEITIILR